MKLASDYLQLAAEIKDRCTDAIDECVFAATEAHLAKKLNDKSGVVLGIAIPAANSTSRNEDNLSDKSRLLFFVLEKFDVSATDDEETTHWDKMGEITKAVRGVLLEMQFEGHELLTEFTEQGVRTEPEYQLFGKYNGYSIGFDAIDYDW